MKVLLAVLLNTVHDRNVANFDDYRAFLNEMTGTNVALWDIGAARRVVAEAILKEHPKLAAHRPPDKTDSGNANRYIRSVAKKLGADALDVPPLPVGAFTSRHLSEAIR